MAGSVMPLTSATGLTMHGQNPAERYWFESRLLLDALYWRSGTDLRRKAQLPLAAIVDVLRKEMGLPTITALIERMVHDARDLQRVRETLTTKLSEAEPAQSIDATMIDRWRDHVLPLLRSTPFPTVWVHDCNDAVLLVQLFAVLRDSELMKRSTVFVTCADAKKADSLRDFLQHAVPMTSGHRPGRIIVAEYNIHTDGTFNEFDFILCGAVLRRLAGAAQRRVMRLLGESLATCSMVQLLTPDPADPADPADAARVAPIFLPMVDGAHLYRHSLLERHAQRRRHDYR